jgi:ferredoxin
MGVGGRTIEIAEVEKLLRHIYEDQWPRFESSVADEQTSLGTPSEAAEHIKAKATQLGADIVGVAEIEATDLYRERQVEHRYAIVLGKRMRYREFQEVPSEASAIECVRIYAELGEICIALAGHLRELGWAAQIEHPIGDSDVLHVPLALKAGFGELGRHGSIIHPKWGPLFRIGSVLTSVPLATDSPIDAGIADFCDKCRACRLYCPADAIPDERDPAAGKDHLGYDRYKVDTGRCFPYFAKNYYCSACLPVCVYNHKEWARDFEGHETKKFPDVVFEDPPAPFDGVEQGDRHRYPRHHRDGIVPIHALRKKLKKNDAG